MTRYMLDTNTVSHLLREHPAVVRHVLATPMSALCISAITEGELQFGLAKRPDAKRLHLAVAAFLQRVDVLAWDSAIAKDYGVVRAATERQGKVLAPLDMLIAGHALSSRAILVTNDQAFSQIDHLAIEDWTR